MATGGGTSKEIKGLLKNAREAIRSKEYKEALKHCKSVLKQDKGNYNALVFIGVAAAELGQPDQAVMAYKKAIETDSQQILAWQGLSGFYEKTDKEEYRPDLLDTYMNMLQLLKDKDDKKWVETAEKLVKMCVTLGKDDVALTYLKLLIDQTVKDTKDTLPYWKQVADILSVQKSLTAENTKQLEQAYKAILNSLDVNQEDHLKYYSGYIKLLQKSGADDSQITKECEKMHELFPSEILPLQALAKIYLKVSPESLAVNNVAVYDKLQSLQKDSGLALLGQGQTKLKEKKYLDAKKRLLKGTELEKSNIYGWLYLAKSQVCLHDNQGAEFSSNEGLKQLRAKKTLSADVTAYLKRTLSLCQADALLDSGISNNVQTAIEIYKKFLGDDSVIIFCKLVQAYILTEDLDTAQQMFDEAAAKATNNEPDVTAVQGLLCLANQKYTEAEQKLLQATQAASDVGLHHYWLGRLYWEMGGETRKDKAKCLGLLLKAAKLDPYYSNTFLYLGHYYWQVVQDKSKGKKCYQKAYELNPRNEAVGAALGDVYLQMGEQESAKELYLNVTNTSAAGTAKWAWLRLGLCYLKLGEATNAISSFQAALRADPKDRHCWECLGEAYMARGSFTAALKSFTRGTELDPSAIYCMFQIAAIKQILGEFREAVAEYQVILDTSPDYIPALKGQGEAYVCLAKASLHQFFIGRAMDYVQLALKVLARAARLRPDLACVWKLLGDACTMLHPLDSQLINLTVPVSLVKPQHEGDNEIKQSKTDLLALGARCYGRAVSIQSDCASLWHDLGVNYYHQTKEININDREDRDQLIIKASKCLKKAICLDTKNPLHWTALFVIANEMENTDLAEHAILKAIELDSQNVVAWTNSGTFYLSKGNIEKAHEAFKTAQSLDPAYVQCWIGQALIAETIGSEETMDLFRHATELATHMEGSIGYAHWVCKTLLDTKLNKKSDLYRFNVVQMNAVPAAMVVIGKYADCASSDPCAHTMLGLLLEHQGLYTAAEKAYARALELLEKSGGKDERNLAYANHARTLCMCGHYEDAVKKYQAITLLVEFSDIIGLAVALFKMKDFSASYQAYEQALQLASNDADKSQILSAMGMVAYKSGNSDQAKTLLFKSCQLSAPSVDGLFALCSLGLVMGDTTLATAAITELHKWQDKEDGHAVAVDVGFLSAMIYALQGNKELACRQVAKLLKRYTDKGDLWNLSAELILQLLPNLAQKAVSYSMTAMDSLTSCKGIPLVNAVAETAAGNPGCLKAAQKAVHLYPDNLNNWATLAASISSQSTWDTHQSVSCNATSTAAGIAKFVHQQAKSTGQSKLVNWSAGQIIWSLVQSGHLEEAQQFLKQVHPTVEVDTELKSFLDLLEVQMLYLKNSKSDSQTVQSIRNDVLKKVTSSQGWQFLAEIYKSEGLLPAAETCYRQALQRASSDQAVILLRLAHLAVTSRKVSDQKERWSNLAVEAISEALKLKPGNPVALLLQGLHHQQNSNTKLAKRSFQQALQASFQPCNLYMRSVTRLQLVKILAAKNDQESIKILLQEAKEEKDPNLEQLDAYAPQE